MLELRPASPSIVRCLARPEELDRLATPVGAQVCRVAPDELLLIGPPGSAGELLEACAPLASGLVLGDPDAFAVWTLAGPQAEEAFARLSAIELPGGRAFLQGSVAGVPAKVLVEAGRIDVFVSSALGHHLRERVLAACADLLEANSPAGGADEPAEPKGGRDR